MGVRDSADGKSVPTALAPDTGLRTLADEADAALTDASAEEIISWAHRTFGAGLVLASSMADTHLVHLAQTVAPGIDVLFLDTGYHFAETIGTRDAVAQTYQVNLVSLTPRQSTAEQDAQYGPRLHERDPELCCALRKVEPLDRGLGPYTAWLNGMRRAESPTRARIRVVDYDAKRDMVKISPLAAWSQDDVAAYESAHGVLVNPLLQDGYTSIGCEPCTRRPLPGQDQRSGRWAGAAKTECGLHA
ncbi:phosphoadenosine phosphosulfate reductase [Kitasatospora sp. MAP12-15]|uniref:phosphoadenylyl-sulfate reductase n=1 Tax=unclassified Kitasatospora TaxID=2633591 RepID=UPI00247388D7|nr:phosphoadenylyl-sulfate reductase [Kitasatospora sp. MAP12-44]MDH6108451.1 phosphoadenosine phosphosulfate reductase [Kitasatospora sp. MAP12-44]